MIIINDSNKIMRTCTKQNGITLLVTMLLMGVLLGISASLISITIKQFQLSGIAYESETAFQAANAGTECALYNDYINNEFALGTRDPMTCFNSISSEDLLEVPGGDLSASSGEEQRFRFSWGAPAVCTEVSVYKFFEDPVADGNNTGPSLMVGGIDMRPGNPCPEGGTCTVIQSRGYNVACANINNVARVVEREYTQVY